MRISKRSWHYNLHDPENPPKNLCTYFWSCVIKLAVLINLAGLLLFLIGWLVYKGLVQTNIGWILLPAVGLVWLGERRWRKRKKRTPKPPGVARSYIRAKKERICPLIEYIT